MGATSGRVLLVEDSRADAIVLLDAFEQAGIDVPVERVRDASAALQAIGCEPPPRLVILDLNVPKGSGDEILGRLRSRRSLESVPVVVLTGSPNPKEEARCRDLGADAFFVKPGRPAEYRELARTIRDRWLG